MAKFLSWEAVVNQTPKLVKRIRDSILYLIGGCLAFKKILAPEMDSEIFGMWCGFAIIVVKAGSMLFGLSDEEQIKVNQEKIEKIVEKSRQ